MVDPHHSVLHVHPCLRLVPEDPVGGAGGHVGQQIIVPVLQPVQLLNRHGARVDPLERREIAVARVVGSVDPASGAAVSANHAHTDERIAGADFRIRNLGDDRVGRRGVVDQREDANAGRVELPVGDTGAVRAPAEAVAQVWRRAGVGRGRVTLPSVLASSPDRAARAAARSEPKPDALDEAPLRIGILGGTFDPPHVGHLWLASLAADAMHLDRVHFQPAAQPPHRAGPQECTPIVDRLLMTRLAIAGNDGLELSTLEVGRAGPSFAVGSVEELLRTYHDAALFLIMSADSTGPHRFLARAGSLALAGRMGGGSRARRRPTRRSSANASETQPIGSTCWTVPRST